jgi:hypothetical protein
MVLAAPRSKEDRVQVSEAIETTSQVDEYTRRTRCQHHWIIEEPNGPTSHGICKRCGAEREFFNNPDAALLNPEGAPSPEPARAA